MSPVIASPRHTYPARCQRATHAVESLKGGRAVGKVCVHGRLLDRTTGPALLFGEGGEIPLRFPDPNHHLPEARPGDLVEVSGRLRCGRVLLVEQMVLLVPAARGTDASVEAQLQCDLRNSRLKTRSDVVAAVRDFFVGNGFLEVETPTLARAPAQERHILPFQTEERGPNQGERFLVSSPEHHMKRLLTRGLERIFQISRCFRNGEFIPPLHRSEFTMVEWYRAYSSYREVAEDTENLVVHVARSVSGTSSVASVDLKIDVTPPWRRMTVDDAFLEYGGVDLTASTSAEKFRVAAAKAGWGRSIGSEDCWEEVFFKLLLESVEPALAALGTPVFLTDYPAQLAAMAKLHGPGDRLAERLEAYVAGIELGNGYTELNDPREQRRRSMAERQARRQQQAQTFPIDEALMRSLACGMPPSGGMALGLDRLVMLVAGARTVHEVVAFST